MHRHLAIIVTFSLFFSSTAFVSSCEKDFIEDEDCRKNTGGSLPDWGTKDNDSSYTPKDSINGVFEITLKDWGESVKQDVIL